MKATKAPNRGLYRLLFFLSSFIFLSFVVSATAFGQISFAAEISIFTATVSFLVYAFVYLLNSGREVLGKNTKAALLCSFAISLGNLILIVTALPQIHITLLAYFLSSYQYIGLFVLLILPLFFLIFFGTWLFRQGYGKVGYAMIGISVAVIAFYFLSGLIFQHYKIDDEIFILLLDTKILFAGMNPYSVSVSQQLFYNVTSGMVNNPSTTTMNTVVGIFSYPSLYILSFVPFYFISGTSVQGLIAVGLKAQEALFLFIALVVTALVIDKKLLGKPVYSLILFTTIALSYLSSIAIYLMFALLLLAYSRLEGRYSWIFLGLCASIQQQLWFPVLLLILYSFNNQGLRAGLRNMVGTLGVFMFFNIYFLAISPNAFLSALFGPVSGMLFPSSFSAIGYMLVTNYSILLSSYSSLFWASIAILSLAFLYLNEKRLVGLFALIPFLFNSHSIPVYYTFFVGFMIVTIFVNTPKKGGVKRYFEKRGIIVAAFVSLILIAAIYSVYISHAAYEKNFDISLSNSSIRFDTQSNQTIYTGNLRYANLTNQTVYLIAVVIAKYETGYEGLLNQSILYQNQTRCSGYPCIVNLNSVVLPKSGNYTLRLHLSRGSYSEPVYGVRIAIYNGNYFYISNSTFNQTILSSFSK